MKQEDRELLLKDLCARLPYGVVVGYSGKDNPNTLDKMGKVIYVDIRFGMIQMQSESGISYGLPPSEFIKPYLRPMSSMTEEEKIDYQAFFNYDGVEYPEEYIDWLNVHHFDYRGLIEKGLALEAPEGMYNT
jgi:hypothetical protein